MRPKYWPWVRGHMAAQIIERANNAKVTIFQNPLLARALYFGGEIGKEIPERLYQAVAVVLSYIYRVDRGEDLERPDVELPEDLRFNENGNLMSGEMMRKHRSLGEIISTATFLGCGVFIFLYSMELFDMGQRLRAYIGLAAALFCIMGGFGSL